MSLPEFVIRKGKSQYATGLCTWTEDPKHAFVFTSVGKRVGLDDAEAWAHSHADHLRRVLKPRKDQHDIRVEEIKPGHVLALLPGVG